VLANELLDNLPFRRVRQTRTGLAEIRIDVSGTRFVEVEVPIDDSLAASLAESVPDAPPLREGEEAIIPVGVTSFLGEIGACLRRGYVLLIDYGSVQGPTADVHGYRRHRVQQDVLADPGATDVTAGVDFPALARRAAERELEALGAVGQRDALYALGLGEWNRQQRDRQSRLMADDQASLAVRIWEGRSRASLLAEPGGLGGLWWLLLATPGLPAPEWLRRAAAARGADVDPSA
jgi:SAM-dependent MidA family methyltransferase